MLLTQTQILAILGAVSLITLISVIDAVFLRMRINKLTRGKNGIDLESIINQSSNDIENLKDGQKILSEGLDIIDNRLQDSVRHIGVVRFNALKDVGGNQSFAIALLNEKDNGLVVSSLYTRERASIFAKPIQNKQSEYELTTEEKKAIKLAYEK